MSTDNTDDCNVSSVGLKYYIVRYSLPFYSHH